MMRIDAHQHFWRIGHDDCIWPTPDEAVIYRDFGPDDLLPLTRAAGIGGSVLVQSQASDRDTDCLLRIAEGTPLVKAVVGWADLKSANTPARIAQLAAHPKMRGLRPMLQDLDNDWICDSALEPAILAMIEKHLSFDALVRPRHLPSLLTFAKRHPGLPIVIDHGAKPAIARGEMEPWRAHMAALAALPQIFCKLSGLVTEAAAGWTVRDLQPYIDHLIAIFGPHRLMWGSDWPVLNLASDYESWLRLAEGLPGLGGALPREALFGGTACRFYRISE